jgi:CheY-like chemotaxis protein
MPERILIVGEVADEAEAFADALAHDFTLSLAATVLDAGKRLQKEVFALIIFDVREDTGQMVDILKTLQQLSPSTPVIVTSPAQDARMIVDAIKAGAADFITRPFATEKLRIWYPGRWRIAAGKRDRLSAPGTGRRIRHRAHHFGQPGHAEGHGEHPAALPDRIHHPHHRRNRNGKSFVRQHPFQQLPPPQALHQGQISQHPETCLKASCSAERRSPVPTRCAPAASSRPTAYAILDDLRTSSAAVRRCGAGGQNV